MVLLGNAKRTLKLKREQSMTASRYNLITEIDENNYSIYNPLSGAFDIASQEEKERLINNTPINQEETSLWLKRGYYFQDKESEELYIKKRYEEFKKESLLTPIQYIFIPNYACNFHCSYCYQHGIKTNQDELTIEKINAFFQTIETIQKENQRDFFITLFGGEPLLPKNKVLMQYFIDKVNEKNISLSVVSNGYYLEEYLDLLKAAQIREIQVTLDGDKDLHNTRRYQNPGDNSFDKIIQGIQKTISLSIPAHVRIIIDKETLPTLPDLAKRLDQLGFLSLKQSQFKTSLGRNYELIEKYNENLLYSLGDLYLEYQKLMTIHPLIKKLHTPSFFGITRVSENKEMYLPNFDSCPAAKTEFVFDSQGFIYGCTASCGRKGYELGTYYPEQTWNQVALKDWQNRSIITIPECKDCSVGVVCGGGCGVIANEQNGKILSPNCKNVKQVMDTGILYYSSVFLNPIEEKSKQPFIYKPLKESLLKIKKL